MDNETKFAAFKLGLESKMERINSSYQEIYGDRPEDVPTVKQYSRINRREVITLSNTLELMNE
jgi:hypothetical protein